MSTKLTLRLDEALIQKAKAFAKSRDKSVSQLVADYFFLLQAPSQGDLDEIGPLTRSLRGILKGANLDEEDYRRYLERKHS
ncbi:MAG TPA: DUF6364 family protein [Candidatus Bipolaricaulota bacterium]